MPSSPAASIRRPQVRELPTSSTRSTSMAPRPGRSASPTSLIGGEWPASASQTRKGKMKEGRARGQQGEKGEMAGGGLLRLLLDVSLDLLERGARLFLADRLLEPLAHPA